MRPHGQIGWVISVEDWALIRRLVADGVPQRQVARQLGIGRSTVARAVASHVPPNDQGSLACIFRDVGLAAWRCG
jgi:DNA invertase Pin-like site-specific DNA recombinase